MTLPARGSARAAVVTKIAILRASCIRAGELDHVEEALDAFREALQVWAWLPPFGRRMYAAVVTDALFDVVASLEETERMSAEERAIVELSLWDAASMVNLLESTDQRRGFAAKRRDKLRRSAVAAATTDFERLLYRWADLLRAREESCRSLPGPLRDDAQAVVDLLATLGLPRRAKALAGRFQVQLSPVAQLAIKHRPPAEEVERNQKLVSRLQEPPRPVALEAIYFARRLERLLSASIEGMPLAVGAAGVINIAGETFGVVPPPRRR